VSDIGTVIVWSDEHHPCIDEGAHEAVYAFSKDKQPDYHVHIGDCLDLGGIGHHVTNDFIAQYEHPVEAGLVSLGRHFNRLAKITPKSKIVWIIGNHDDRLDRFAQANPAWRGIVDRPLKLLRGFGDCTVTDRIKVVRLDDFEDDFKIGKMHFCHGFSACLHVASKTVDAYDESITFGHAHTMQMFTRVKKHKPRAGYCVGHMMSKEGRRYLKGTPVRWVTGFGYMEYLKKNGNFNMYLMPIIDGGFIYGGKYYSGKKKAV